jgi:DNA-binding transcriptional MerR regulator
MRITEAARRLGMSPRMLRYREALGLLPAGHRTGTHRRYAEDDLAAVTLALDLEKRYDVSPAALAFGLRVLADREVAARVRELGQRTGRLAPPTARAVDFEKQRALRWLNGG